MNIRIAIRIALLICATLAAHDVSCGEGTSAVNFANHARLVLSEPVSPKLVGIFGPGWTRLTYIRPDGTTIPILRDESLTADGGIVFSPPVERSLSSDGRYIVLNWTRNGVTSDEAGRSTVESRQFCPVLDTTTGCVFRNESGDVCGGTWDAKSDAWHDTLGSGEAQSVERMARPRAENVWAQYSGAPGGDIKDYLGTALGLDNLKACDPLNAANARYYAKIEAVLGQMAQRKNSPVPPDDGASPRNLSPDEQQIGIVNAERAWIYAQPSVGSSHRGYLIRGDHVTVIGKADSGWLNVRYVRTNKPPIEAWLQGEYVSR
jgi:hypothetical protein